MGFNSGFKGLRFPRQCPLDLLAKVVCRRKALESETDYARWTIWVSCRGHKMNRISF